MENIQNFQILWFVLILILFVGYSLLDGFDLGIGVLLIALGLRGAYLLWTKKIYENKLYLFILPFLIPLPHIAHETGWIAAEVGRQPWIIYKLMKTADAVSVVVTEKAK